MKRIKYLLFIIPFLFGFNVFAQNYNVSSSIKYNVSLPGGSYGGDDINDGYNTIMGRYTVGTRYNGRLGYLEFFLSCDSFNCSTNHTYTITLNMATNDWRNNFMSPIVQKCNSDGSVQATNYNLTVSNFRFVSRKQIKFNFKTNSTLPPYFKFKIYSLNYVSQGGTAITGDSNWNLSSISISDNVSSGGGSSGSTPTPTPTPSASNKDIIDNANQNTDNIIDNANQNTDDIINNNNANTKEIIENNQKLLGDCITNLMTGSDVLSLDNLYMSGNNFQQITADDNPTLSLSLQAFNDNSYLYNIGDTQYITETKTYTIRFTKSADFNRVKLKLNGRIRDTGLIIDVSFLADDHVYYISADFFRITQGDIRFNHLIIKESSSPGFVAWGETVCLSKLDSVGESVVNGAQSIIDNVNNGNQQINDNLDDIKDSLTDETTPEIDLDLDLDTNSPVSDLLTMPITILNKVFDVSDDTCQPYVLPFDFFGGNNTITFPCIDLRDYLGNSVYNILDTILCFFFCYEIGMMCVSIYEDITSLRDGFDSLYTPKHAKPLGKHTKEVE